MRSTLIWLLILGSITFCYVGVTDLVGLLIGENDGLMVRVLCGYIAVGFCASKIADHLTERLTR